MARIDDRMLDLNRHGVLRIPAAMWLALLFLARHWVLVLVVTVSARRNQEAIRLYGSDFNWWLLLAEAPALLVLWLCSRRRPEAGLVVRWLWPHVRLLASMTALFHIGYVGWYLWQSSYWLPWPELYLASSALIDLAIVGAFHNSGHLKQVFSEFPAPRDDASAP